MSVDARLEELKQDLAQLSGPSTRRLGERRRGRETDYPEDLPPRGWTNIAWRAWAEISDQNLFLIAGGVTYAVLLALFPGLAALVSLYGLVFDTRQIEQQVAALTGILPAQTQELLSQELHSLVESSNGTLRFAAVVGLLLAFWTASRGVSGLMTAINIAYEEKERRSMIRFNLIAIGMTFGLVVGGVLAIALIAVLPAVVQLLAVGAATRWLLMIVQWPLLILLVMLGLAVLYRFGPDRDMQQCLRWASPGAITATIFWIIASLGFTAYVANFQQLRQDLWIARRRGDPFDLALSLGAHGAAWSSDQRAIRTTDTPATDRRRAGAGDIPLGPSYG